MSVDPHTVLFSLYRWDGTSREDFERHYLDVHVPIGARMPGLLSYRTFVNREPEAASGRRAPDAFAVMTFESREAFELSLRSEVFAEAVADNVGVVGESEAFQVDERDGFSDPTESS